MDKKNTVIGVVLLIAAFGAFYWSSRNAARHPPPSREVISAPGEIDPAARAAGETPGAVEGAAPIVPQAAPVVTSGQPLYAEAQGEGADDSVVTLRNEFISVDLTGKGGAIRDIRLLKFAAVKNGEDPYVFNELRFLPALSLVDFPGADASVLYEMVEQGAHHVVFRTVIDGRMEITRTYRVANGGGGDPYVIRHEMTLRNLVDEALATPRLALNLGTAAPISAKDSGMYLNVGFYNGDKATFIGRNKFGGGGFLSMFGMGSSEPVPVIRRDGTTVWASVKNQFFTSVLTPDEPGTGILTRRVEFPVMPGEEKARIGITGSLETDPILLAASGEKQLGFDFYVGPKEFSRLESFEERQDLVMQFGFFGFFSKLLLQLMSWIHGFLPNYGVAIILTTLLIKTILWPLTAQAARSSKRMAKIQEPLKEIREKYKDNPQKQQQETLALFKANKINPLGGCLPIFVQIPIFFGLFRMLQSASELRFAEFLWIGDLSAPDTLAHVFGFPFNLLPLFMGVTMYYQMKMMPTPTVDNAQAKMFKFMPFIFLIFCYNFSSGLVLYWTVQNLFTIGQQFLTNRRPDPGMITPITDPKKAKQIAAAKGPQQEKKLNRGLPSQPKRKKKKG
ncbi:MAG: membrane protein insertase YidC [Opitutaceae bacterium]